MTPTSRAGSNPAAENLVHASAQANAGVNFLGLLADGRKERRKLVDTNEVLQISRDFWTLVRTFCQDGCITNNSYFPTGPAGANVYSFPC